MAVSTSYVRDFEEEQRRQTLSLAQELAKLSNDTTPIRAHSQGMARVAQGLLSGYLMGREERLAREREDRRSAEADARYGHYASLLLGQGGAAPQPQQPQPEPTPAPQGGFGGSTLGTGPSEPPAGMYGRNAPLVPQRDATLGGTPEQMAGASASRAAATNPLLQPGTQYRANPGTGGAFAGLPAPSGQVPALPAGSPLAGPLPGAAPQQQAAPARPGIDLNAVVLAATRDLSSPNPIVREQARGLLQGLPALRASQERGEDLALRREERQQTRADRLEDRAAQQQFQLGVLGQQQQFQTEQQGRREAFDEAQQGRLLAAQRERLTAEQQQQQATQGFSRGNTLRDEFTTLTKPFREVQDAFGRLQGAAQSNSPAGDMAMLYAFNKLLDPGSVVRESEFATTAATGSLGERMQALVGRLLTGQRLTDDQRADFMAQAKALVGAQRRSYDQVTQQYRSLAERHGVRPEDVITDFLTPPLAPPPPAPASTATAPATGGDGGWSIRPAR